MKNIIEIVLSSGWQTQVFIILSLIFLTFLQYWILALKRISIVFLALIHVGFGFLLSKISVYNAMVHVVVYVIPSFVIAYIIRMVKNKKQSNESKSEFPFFYDVVKGEKLRIDNIFRHLGVIGGSGSGKTVSIIKPTIKQCAKYDFSLIVHDYKNADLARTVYTHYMESKVEFQPVVFFDLNLSMQVNPISPDIIKSPPYANVAAEALMKNLTKQGKGGDSWFTEVAESAFAGVLWRFVVDYPEKCMLPYVVSVLMLWETERIVKFIKGDTQATILGASYIKAVVSDKQAAAVESTLSNALRKIALPDVYWITGGNQVNLRVNDPDNPTAVCLCNEMTLDTAYSPIIALIMDISSKLMSERGGNPTGKIVEEGSAIYLPGLSKIAAVLREFKVFVMFCIQDITQGEILYDKAGVKALFSNLGSQFYGRVMDMDTAERYAKMYGRIFKSFKSKTKRRNEISTSSITESERQVFIKEPETFLHLEPGEFFGLASEGNRQKFENRFKPYTDKDFDLPKLNNLSKEQVNEHFNSIIEQVNLLS